MSEIKCGKYAKMFFYYSLLVLGGLILASNFPVFQQLIENKIVVAVGAAVWAFLGFATIGESGHPGVL